MQAEIEAKFLNTNHDEIRDRLQTLGAICIQPSRQMLRKNFDYPDGRLEKIGGWVRVRDEGDKTTLAYKQLDNRGIDGTKEVSVVVSSFDDTCQLLESIGLKQNSFQETKRESWILDSVEIELDEWPWIKPYIEVEAKDESSLIEVINKLGLNVNDAVHGSVEVAYMAEYEVTEEEVDNWQEIKFTDVPDWLESKRK
jgi:adenylate cyclase class 2